MEKRLVTADVCLGGYMAEWLFPVNPAIYDIDRAYNDSYQICWAKNDFEFQINDILFLYMTEPIGKIQYQYQVVGFANRSELPEKDRDYWLNKKELEEYRGDYFIINPIKKVDKATLSRRYLIEKELITPKDTLQSHKTTKIVKSKSLEKVEAHKHLLSYIAHQFEDINDTNYPDEANMDIERYPEGAKQSVLVNKYERNPEARAKCLEIHGTRCKICDMSFVETYGFFAKDFIHVHHVTPLHQISESYEVNPETDLIPVCPNCHAMLHKTENGLPMTVERLKLLFELSKKN